MAFTSKLFFVSIDLSLLSPPIDGEGASSFSSEGQERLISFELTYIIAFKGILVNEVFASKYIRFK